MRHDSINGGDQMAKTRNSIQSVLNAYLERKGSIDILLPDGVELEIGITRQGKLGVEKSSDYCWVVATRDDRATSIDRYSMSMEFDDTSSVVDQTDQGRVTII